MEVHTCLFNEVDAFHFSGADFDLLREAMPGVRLVEHANADAFLSSAASADYLLTWEFSSAWYDACPRLRAILTPAAGQDWVEYDPSGRVPVIHGTFHGEILAESLLSALLYMNHAGPLMERNYRRRAWDRNLQRDCRLLRNQVVLIIGYGSIGRVCGELIGGTGAQVIGIRQTSTQPAGKIPVPIPVYSVNELPELLPEADHVVLLLPGSHDTDAFMSEALIRSCKPGAFLYNFGRGNALASSDLIATLDHIGGAFLDVTDEEPLPPASPLWHQDNIMITPHSSCVYQEYRMYFLREAVTRLQELQGP